MDDGIDGGSDPRGLLLRRPRRDGDGRPPRTVAVTTAFWWASWTATPLLVVVSRLFPGRPALARGRRWAGRAALLPPVVVILLTLTL